MKKILITGSNGLLGQNLVTFFYEKGIDFIAISRGENRLKSIQFDYHDIDLLDNTKLTELFNTYKFSSVINTIAMTEVDKCEIKKPQAYQLNVETVKNLAKECQKQQAQLIQISTDFVFDGYKQTPYTEKDKTNPLNYYAETKYLAEQVIIKLIPNNHTIIRTAFVYGKAENNKRSDIVNWVRTSLENKQPIKVINNQYRTPTFVKDLALGCYLSIFHNYYGIINISGNECMKISDICYLTAKHFNLNNSLITEVPDDELTLKAKRPSNTCLSIQKAKTILRYIPKSFVNSLDFI